MPNLDRDYYLDKSGLNDLVSNLETTIVAEDYSSSSPYAVGDYCTYSNKMYRCKTAISVAEAWTSTHWEQVIIGDELEKKSEIISITKEQWDALSAAQKASGDYVITNPDTVPITANLIPYDGTYTVKQKIDAVESEIPTVNYPVTSVNSKTGAVVLSGTDIKYDSNTTLNAKINAVEAEIPTVSYPVTSVNTKTGAVVLDGTDIKYNSTTTVNAKIDAVEAAIPVVNYPVTSVNTKTGTVVLSGSDINYSSGTTVNAKIDAVEASIPTVNYPVTSVNSKTGAVVLSGSDINYSSGVTVNQKIDANEIKSVTTAQWDALTPAQKSSGDYVITDVSGATLNASLMPYSNTSSGLSATDVQTAIDEIALNSVIHNLPTTAGTYVLKVAVSGNTRTYSWVAITPS